MEIIRSINVDGNLNTELYSLLSNISDDVLFNDDHDLRKPISIYNIAFDNVVYLANLVVEDLLDGKKDVKKNYKLFLESVNSFVDDGYNIIKCFYPKTATNSKSVFSDKWLECVDSVGIKQYKTSINSAISTTRYIVNKIKHEHGRLGQIFIETSFGCCAGYFLEKYNNGTLQPDEFIHSKFQKHHTAFSYVQDLMRNIGTIYYVAEKISQYIKKNILKDKPSNNSASYDKDENIRQLVNKIWATPLLLFPDEYEKTLTIVDIVNNKLIIKRPIPYSYLIKYKRYSQFKCHLLASGDGTSKSFGVPYLGI